MKRKTLMTELSDNHLVDLLLLCILGASSDFDGATKIAKLMVTRFGMSDKVTFSFVRGNEATL